MSGFLNEVTCSCDRCKAMCANSTCVPTPDEARNLIRHGYANRLVRYEPIPGSQQHAFVAPKTLNTNSDVMTNTNGQCTFYNCDLCELHDARLKPMEGRLAHHTRSWQEIRKLVVETWKGKLYESVVKTLQRYQDGH